MKNPWLDFDPNEKKTLKGDEMFVCKINANADKKNRFDLELRPDPYIGKLDAPITFLSKHPGITEPDNPLEYKDHLTEIFIDNCNGNQRQSLTDYPFYYLNPALKNTCGGKYWHRYLNRLVKEFGDRRVSDKICVLQLYPYHVWKLKNILSLEKERRVSADFLRFLLIERIKVGDPIICLIARKSWLRLVPELKGYKNFFAINNPLKPYLTEKNCDGKRYKTESFFEIIRQELLVKATT